MAVEKDDSKDPVREELKRQLLLHGLLKDLAPLFDKADGSFYNLFSGEAQLTVPFLLEVESKLGISPQAILRAVKKEPFQDPVELLMAHRESAELPASPYLDELISRVVAVLDSEVDRQIFVSSEAMKIEGLEEQRYSDPTAAREACEQLTHRLLQTVEELPSPKPGKLVGELAAALALWGTVQRSRGFRDLAVKAFGLAFPLARHSKDPWALGVCFKRAAYLLGDLGRNDLGYDFVREAFVFFGAAESPANLWRSQRDRGHFLTHCGKLDDAKEAFQWALERLPGSDWRDRVGALQGLGVVARRQGNLEKARSFLISAAAECQRTDIFLAHIKWSRAKVEAKLGQLSMARNFLDEATTLMAQYGSAGDVALICVDHVELLLRQNERRRAAAMVSEVAAWLPRLRANPILCRAFARFLDLARAARIELATLPEIREDLKKALKRGETP